MVSQLIKRLKWVIWYRVKLQYKTKGFNASILSFCHITCVFSEHVRISSYCVIKNSNINRFSFINSKTQVLNSEIGAFCSVGQNVKIGGFGIHPNNISTHSSFFSKTPPSLSFNVLDDHMDYKDVVIGNDVWIGDNAMILDGVKIGTGAIIAAGAVVVKDVGPYHVVGGVPAKTIKLRFSEKEIELLLKSQWWCFSEDRLTLLGKYIGQDDVLTFIKNIRQ